MAQVIYAAVACLLLVLHGIQSIGNVVAGHAVKRDGIGLGGCCHGKVVRHVVVVVDDILLAPRCCCAT